MSIFNYSLAAISIAVIIYGLMTVYVIMAQPSKESFLYKTTAWVTIVICSTISFAFFRIMHRTTLRGNIKEARQAHKQGKLVICCNHLSAWDNFCLATALGYPWFIFHPSRVPINSPKFRREITKKSIQQRILELLNCVFINPKASASWFNEVTKRLAENNHQVIVLGEGTRAAGDKSVLQRWQPGAAKLVADAQATWIPVGIRGMENILPVGSKIPKLIGKRVCIYFGEPVQFNPAMTVSEIQAAQAEQVQFQLRLASTLLAHYQQIKALWS